jgi:hypothetical protein
MDQDLLHCLLAAFPDDDGLVICGYRVPFEAATDDALLAVLKERYRNGMTRVDAFTGIDRG